MWNEFYVDDDDYEHLDDEEVPPHVAVSVPKVIKKRTELENLKITLKGWNLTKCVSFTCNAAKEDMMKVNKDAADGCEKQGYKGQFREGEDEDADKEFNFVIKMLKIMIKRFCCQVVTAVNL